MRQQRVRILKTNSRFISASSWWTGEWSECSRSCNGGLRTREVLCKRRISAVEEKVLDDSACTSTRPSFTEPCSNHSCPPEWLALDWSEVQTRFCSLACFILTFAAILDESCCFESSQKHTVVCKNKTRVHYWPGQMAFAHENVCCVSLHLSLRRHHFLLWK